MLRLSIAASFIMVCVACGGDSSVNNGPGGPATGGSASSAQGGSGATTSTGGDATGGNATGGNGSGASGGAAQGGSASGGNASGGNASGGSGGGGGNGGAGGAGQMGDPCTLGGGNCMDGFYCDAPGCGGGTCQAVLNIAAQTKEYDPVCGCDGANYFNATIAASFGAAVNHTGVCTALEEMACDKVANPCLNGLKCSITVATSGMCSPTLTAGVCWGPPFSCDTGQPMARGCIPPNNCANKCALIHSENGWYEDVTCQ